MAHLSAQPRAEYCRHGSVRCSNDWLRSALCLCHYSTRPQRPCLDQRHNKSDSRMDRASDNGSIPLEWGAALPHPRSGSNLWRHRNRPIASHGIRDKPVAPASPWQNGFVERLIGSIRRECVDHFIVLGEAHLCHILRTYAHYYNDIRTHRSLDKDAPTLAPFSGSDLSIHTRSLADFITITSGFRFSVHTSGRIQITSGRIQTPCWELHKH